MGLSRRMRAEASRLLDRFRAIVAEEGTASIAPASARWVERMAPRTWGAGLLFWRLVQLRRRADRVFTIAFLDVDGLTAIDRGWGRTAAKRALNATLSAVRAELGPRDRCFRYGGDEFVCVFEAADPQHAAAVLQAARDRLEAQQAGLRFTFGIATAEPAHTPYSLMKEAEARMSAAKHLRRERGPSSR